MSTSNRINLAIMTQSLDAGGAERLAGNMSVDLADEYNVFLFCFNSKNIKYAYGGQLITYNNTYNMGNPFSHALSFFRRVQETKALKKKYHIDCTISHQDRPNIINVLSSIGEKKICVFHNSPSSLMSTRSIRAKLQKYCCKHSDRYIGVSKLACLDFVKRFGFDTNKVETVYNYCDTEEIRRLSEVSIEDETVKTFFEKHNKVIVYAGRMLPRKGHQHLLRALSIVKQQYPNIGLICLGEGEKKDDIACLAKKLSLTDNVYMPGFIDNPFRFMRRADLFVLPSDFEGLPMVLIEAASCGCPLVSCDIATGPREILAPSTEVTAFTHEIEFAEYGVLVPACSNSSFESTEASDTERKLAEAIATLLSDEVLMEKYRQVSGKCAERFSVNTISEQWKALIKD